MNETIAPTRSKRRRTILVVVTIVFVLVAGVVIGGLLWVQQQLGGDPGPGDPVSVQIAPGSSVTAVGDQLAEAGVIRNALAFRLVAQREDLAADLLAGTYELETGMSVDEAIAALRAGPLGPETVRFTIAEGLAVDLVIESLAKQFDDYDEADFRKVLDERIDAGSNADGVLRIPDWVPEVSSLGPEVREPFEGLLFPETYDVLTDATPRSILQRMLDQLDRVAEDTGLTGADDPYEALIVASLIERETRVDDERSTVSGVIDNRLEAGQPLQLDATCLYALGQHRQRVLTSDCEIDSPYNTYVVTGLPPTPISGAGRASIRAALNPDDVPYFYYVVRAPECDGTHVFAETLSEHNRNVEAYRNAGRCGV